MDPSSMKQMSPPVFGSCASFTCMKYHNYEGVMSRQNTNIFCVYEMINSHGGMYQVLLFKLPVTKSGMDHGSHSVVMCLHSDMPLLTVFFCCYSVQCGVDSVQCLRSMQ